MAESAEGIAVGGREEGTVEAKHILMPDLIR